MSDKVTIEQLREIVRLRAQSKARPDNVVAYGAYCEAVMKVEEALVEEALERRKPTPTTAAANDDKRPGKTAEQLFDSAAVHANELERVGKLLAEMLRFAIECDDAGKAWPNDSDERGDVMGLLEEARKLRLLP